MARQIPEVVRAAAGLAATVLDEARKLPETLPGLPVRLIGMTLQQAMKVQQQYAGLVARGDELFTGLRGENEPGLATFDDDDEPVTVTQPPNGYRESAFDRAGDSFTVDETLTDEEVRTLPADPPADTVTAVVDELADQVESGRRSIEEIADEAPAIEEILDEIAIDELVDHAPPLDETSPDAPALSLVQDAPVTEDAGALESALLESDEAAAEAAAPGPKEARATQPREAAKATSGKADGAAPTDDRQGAGDFSGPQAAGTAPIDGYDSFSIAQLRGRLRGYALSTVQDLLTYEEATRAREPYLRLLRNRLEKLEQQAVESSPLAPRGT